MGKIRILDETISGRIAAGEVVERPASIVKELIENSIDAGATSIAVSITDGGIRSIRVSDNGSGIAREDMPLTVIKHATSKIRSLSDLDAIYTMGFRGEALSSISAVSMMKIRSKTADAELGTELSAKGGKVESIREAGLPDGTVVLVENLFYNTPARLKFLKKPGTEATAVSAVIADQIIAHPEISFQYTSNGQPIYHSPGNGELMDAIISVEGVGIRANLAEVNIRLNEISIKGYLSLPSISFKRNNGRVYVNTRAIRSNIVSDAVLNAYGQRLLKGSFPYYVLHMSMPPRDVDVNVHPNKLQVHFRDDNAVAYVVSAGVDEALSGSLYTPVVEFSAPEERKPAEPPKTAPEVICESVKPVIHEPIPVSEELPPEEALKEVTAEMARSMEADRNSLFDFSQFSDLSEPAKEEPAEEIFEQPKIFTELVNYHVLGAVFNTYILVEAEDTLYLVDQHAAHERLVYDQLKSFALEDVPVQRFLISDVVHFSHEEAQIIEENMEMLKKMGIELEPFGSLSYKIDAVPQIVSGVKPAVLIRDILDELTGSRVSGSVILADKIAKAACKRAVKAGQALPPDVLSQLVREFIASGTIPNCPHGRPIAIALTRKQLEKSFGRRL